MTWPMKKLGEVCDIVKSGIGFFNGEKEYVDTGSLINGTVISSETITYKKRPSRANTTAMTGDILVAKMKDTSKVRLATEEDERKRIFSTGFFVFKTKPSLTISKYLFFYFLSPNFQDLKNSLSHGATQRAINNQDLEKYFKIPLPMIGEQRKIVGRIEKLFAKIDEAQKLREESKKSASALLQSALNEIFSKPKTKFWTEKRISDLALEIKSGFACGKSNEVDDGVVHLRTHNIDLSGEINLQKIVRMPQKMVDSDVYDLKKGDIVFNNTNSVELVGKTIIIRENLPYAFSNHLTRIRFDKNLIISEWALIILKKYWQEKYFESICTRWVGQAGINQTNLGKITIPLPPLAEQKKIVIYLDSLSEKVRELQKFQNETEKDLVNLKQSILQKSFSGGLVK